MTATTQQPRTRNQESAPNTPVVGVDRVSRKFGDNQALDDVSLSIASGELLGLLGPNGAGKTTLISMLAGQRRPDEGTVRVLGGNPRDPATRSRLGTTPQQTGLPGNIKVREVIEFTAKHFPDPLATGPLLERFGLSRLSERKCSELSGGEQRRLAVALATVGQPQLILLDEPTTGLDVDARQTLWQAIEGFQADGGTVLVTSHYIEEIQRLADRVVVIDHGQVLVDDTTQAVISHVDVDRVSLISDDPRLDALPEVVSLDRGEHAVDILTRDADALVRRLVTDGVDFSHLRVSGASLEDAFAQMTGTS